MFPRHRHSYLAVSIPFYVVTILLGLIWLLKANQPLFAQSQPEALGSLEGVVRNAQGNPLPNITVSLEHYLQHSPTRLTKSNAQGRYHFASVTPGNYWLRFEDSKGHYASTYYTDAYNTDDATKISISGNNVTAQAMQLPVGGSISVTVKNADPVTLTAVIATLYRQTRYGNWTIFDSASTPQGSDAVGMSGLPAGAYRLCITAYVGYYFSAISECYDNVIPNGSGQSAPASKEINIRSGEETKLTITINDVSQVSGNIRLPNNQPAEGIYVGIVPSLYGFVSQVVKSDENGYFHFGFLPSGSYYLIYNYSYEGQNQYLSVAYPDPIGEAYIPPLSLDASSRLVFTHTLMPQSRITGKITLPDGVPLASPDIRPLRPVSNGSWGGYPCAHVCPQSTYDFATGAYTVTQLSPGRYRVLGEQFIVGSLSYLIGYYGGSSLETADDIVLGKGETKTGISFTLGRHDFDSSLSGIVSTGETGSAGTDEGVGGIEVGLFTPFFLLDTSVMPYVSTFTNEQGHYRFDGLAIGAYQVGFRDTNGLYATRFYTETQTLHLGTSVYITQTGERSNINVSLTPGATIRGTVRTPAGLPRGGYSVQAIPILFHNFFFQTIPSPFIDERSNSDGSFEITGLPAGTYFIRIQFRDENFNYVYRYHPSGGDLSFARQVVLAQGQTSEDIDIYLQPTPPYYLPLLYSAAEDPQP